MDPVRMVIEAVFVVSGMFSMVYLGGLLVLLVTGQDPVLTGWHLMFVLINWSVCSVTGCVLIDLLKGE